MSNLSQYKKKSPACQEAPERERRSLSPFAIGLGALLLGAGFVLGTRVYAHVATHPPRFRVRRKPLQFGLEYEDVTFPSADGLQLSGWFIPPRCGEMRAVVIVCHGYPMNRVEMLPHARFLSDAGYATLLFDFRALGESEGDLCSAGYHEVKDMAGALDYLASRPDTAHLPVGALGQSLGGAVSIMTAARDERIRAVVAEATYPDLQDAMEARFRFPLGARFAKLVALPIRHWAKRYFDFHPRHVSPLREIRHIAPRAVMIIQGQRDLLVRWQDAVRIFANAQEPRELWLLKHASHAACLRSAPEEYAARVVRFFDQHL